MDVVGSRFYKSHGDAPRQLLEAMEREITSSDEVKYVGTVNSYHGLESAIIIIDLITSADVGSARILSLLRN